ncbi:MAG: class II aldolase/adducin family protein [Saprospiraceae bacterium]|nr:class II aldolase/adducin family protein [Saprospiraceae bacterium]
MDEGYIKFQAKWEKAQSLSLERLENLIFWRDILYQKGLVGVYENGIGYGNISQRWNAQGQFIISGSMTGHLQTLSKEHFTLVTKVNIAKNTVWCEGPIIASSETMSHAVIYQECPEVESVMHVHHIKLWEKLLHKVPTTNASATYGSPEMAYSIIELLQKTDLRKQKIFVMEGHPEGIFVFGESLKEAADILLQQITYL